MKLTIKPSLNAFKLWFLSDLAGYLGNELPGPFQEILDERVRSGELNQKDIDALESAARDLRKLREEDANLPEEIYRSTNKFKKLKSKILNSRIRKVYSILDRADKVTRPIYQSREKEFLGHVKAARQFYENSEEAQARFEAINTLMGYDGKETTVYTAPWAGSRGNANVAGEGNPVLVSIAMGSPGSPCDPEETYRRFLKVAAHEYGHKALGPEIGKFLKKERPRKRAYGQNKHSCKSLANEAIIESVVSRYGAFAQQRNGGIAPEDRNMAANWKYGGYIDRPEIDAVAARISQMTYEYLEEKKTFDRAYVSKLVNVIDMVLAEMSWDFIPGFRERQVTRDL